MELQMTINPSLAAQSTYIFPLLSNSGLKPNGKNSFKLFGNENILFI